MDVESESAADHAYFQAIEQIFLDLRGAPLLVLPADWQLARRWREDGVPVELVRRALEEVFTRHRARAKEGRISSLRYCAPAVAKAWREWREMTAPGVRDTAAPLAVADRLARLAASLPALLPGREEAVARVVGLATLEHDPRTVEAALAELDNELLAGAVAALPEQVRVEVEAEATRSLATLSGRLGGEELARSRERLLRQLLRRRLGLPLLSLFSPEAELAAAPPAAAHDAGGTS